MADPLTPKDFERRVLEIIGEQIRPGGNPTAALEALEALMTPAARATAYTPADPSAWSPPPPQTIGEAFDRVRRAVSRSQN